MNNSQHILTFKNLSNINGLIHGFSTRFFGSMRPDDPNFKNSLSSFSQSLQIHPNTVVSMQQIHGNNVQWATQNQAGQRIPETDGIFTNEQNLFLTVLSADCVPLLLYDSKKKTLGAVHAGWRGVYNEIIKDAVSELTSKGSNPKDLLIAIGPCIRVCCYNISAERADLFRNKFPGYTPGVESRNQKTFLDLPGITKQQLYAEGVQLENIEDCGICTSDHLDRFFSFRREGENFGEFIGIIGLSSRLER